MIPSSRDITSSPAARVLAIGFGSAVAMWAVAYVSLMQPGLIVGEALFGAILLCIAIGGAITGRWEQNTQRAVVSGAWVGIVIATLNLMILGAMLVDAETGRMQPNAIAWIAGNIIGSIVLAMIGAVVGRQLMKIAHDRAQPNWFYRFNVIAAATVLLLLITGGFVTGLKAGLAVPDWPTSFGHNMLLYPLSEMVGGVYYEHAHRLYGMLVGVTAIVLCVSAFVFDKRGWFRLLAVTYLLMVCVQGYMGGKRVSEISITLAIVHGVFGQIIFATVVGIAAMSSTTWRNAMRTDAITRSDRRWSLVLFILLIVQLGLGAMYRHMHRDLADPPHPLHPLLTHIVVAVVITIVLIMVAGRAWGVHRDKPVLPAIGRTLLILVCAQLVLGISAMIVVWMSKPDVQPMYEVGVTTAHQITGALMLATTGLLALWVRRLGVARH